MGVYTGIALDNAVITSGSATLDYLSIQGPLIADVSTVAALGSSQTDAAALEANAVVVTVTAADATKGVRLPAATAGRILILKNTANAVLKVYPASSAKINILADNASLNMAAYTSVVLFATSPTQWYTVPLLPS